MTLGQSLFNALKGKLIRTTFLLLIVRHLEYLMFDTVRQYHRTGIFHPFENFDSFAFTSHVARGLNELLGDNFESQQGFVVLAENSGVRVFRTWDTVVEALVGKLRFEGYSNIERAVDYIILAVMCLAFWNDMEFWMSEQDRQVKTLSFVNILQLALDALSSVPQPEAEAHGGGSGEPQPEAEAHGGGSGEPQPEAEAHGGGSGEPQPEAEAHGGGSGEPQPEEGSADVPLDAGTVRGVRRYRLRDTPEREISRQRRARSRYNLRETPARQHTKSRKTLSGTAKSPARRCPPSSLSAM